MNKEKIDEVNAHLALAEYNKKDRLQKVINESFLHYYFGGVIKVIASVLIVSYLFAVAKENAKGLLIVLSIYLVIFILVELNRQHCRFNALVKLLEIEKEKNENKTTSGDGVPPTPES